MEYPIVKIAYNGMQSRKETQNISVHYKCSNLYLNNSYILASQHALKQHNVNFQSPNSISTTQRYQKRNTVLYQVCPVLKAFQLQSNCSTDGISVVEIVHYINSSRQLLNKTGSETWRCRIKTGTARLKHNPFFYKHPLLCVRVTPRPL